MRPANARAHLSDPGLLRAVALSRRQHSRLQPTTIPITSFALRAECFSRSLCTNADLYKEDRAWGNVQSVQCSAVAQSCLTLCDPMNRSTPGLPVHHQLPEFTQTRAHRVSDAIQPSHPLLSPSPPAPNPSQHPGLFQRVNSSHEVAKVLEF